MVLLSTTWTLQIGVATPVPLLPPHISIGARADSCGVSRPLFNSSAQTPVANRIPLQLQCEVPYLMACRHWKEFAAKRLCPTPCPYTVRLVPFACTFVCVAPERCADANANTPFANPETSLCEHANVRACQMAVSATQCTKCRRHFDLAEGGTYCERRRNGLVDETVGRAVDAAYMAAFPVGIGASVFLLLLLWRLCHGLDKNWDIVAFAQTHRRLCKLRHRPAARRGALLYPLCVNVHTRFLVGLGMPLYYNSLVFLLVLAVAMYIAVSVAVSGHSSAFALASGVEDASICGWPEDGEGEASAMDMNDANAASRHFMTRMAMATLSLYFVALVMTLAHAWHQLWYAEWFNSRHTTLKDVALKIGNLPQALTDERELATWLSEQLDAQVRGVSIAYDCWNRAAEVQALVDRHLAYADAKARGGYPPGIGITPLPHEIMNRCMKPDMEECWRRDRDLVRMWFDPDAPPAERMWGAGYAFVVLSGPGERDRVLRDLERFGRRLTWSNPASGEDHVLRVETPKHEPTSIRWPHLCLNLWHRAVRLVAAVLVWLSVCIALVLLVFWPYAVYFTSYLNEVGSQPSGLTMTVLGWIMALSQWIICVLLAVLVERLGLHSQESEMIVIFLAFTHFCLLTAAFNVFLTWYYANHVWSATSNAVGTGPLEWLNSAEPWTLRELRAEIDLGNQVLRFLVPGALFVPSLMWPLCGFVWPYVWGMIQLLLRESSGSGRQVERKLEPLPIGLPWDYQGHITLPACCCLTLFVVSPAMVSATGSLCAWCLFFYIFQRCMHLRCARKAFFTTNKLDKVVLYTWGLVLAELAACHAFWRVRLKDWPIGAIPIAFVASLLLYWFFLRLLCRFRKVPQQREEDRPVAAKVCYDWLNVNPVRVLKSQYVADSGLSPAVFYDPGKEYLQLHAGLLGPPFERGVDVDLSCWWDVRGKGDRWEVEDFIECFGLWRKCLAGLRDRLRRRVPGHGSQEPLLGDQATCGLRGRTCSGAFMIPLPWRDPWSPKSRPNSPLPPST